MTLFEYFFKSASQPKRPSEIWHSLSDDVRRDIETNMLLASAQLSTFNMTHHKTALEDVFCKNEIKLTNDFVQYLYESYQDRQWFDFNGWGDKQILMGWSIGENGRDELKRRECEPETYGALYKVKKIEPVQEKISFPEYSGIY